MELRHRKMLKIYIFFILSSSWTSFPEDTSLSDVLSSVHSENEIVEIDMTPPSPPALPLIRGAAGPLFPGVDGEDGVARDGVPEYRVLRAGLSLLLTRNVTTVVNNS